MRPRRLLLLVSLPLLGCFDVHTVDPGPFVIDDFDDGDFTPADPNLSDWSCYAFNPASNRNYKCDHEAEDLDDYSLFLDATITDVADGTQQRGGASLATFATSPEDFTRFTALTFAVERLQSAVPALPSEALVYVELGCGHARTASGGQPGDLYVVQGVDYKNFWQTKTLPLSSFGPPPWVPTPIEGGTAGCLRQIDSIRFTLDAAIADGQAGHGILHIDDVRLQ